MDKELEEKQVAEPEEEDDEVEDKTVEEEEEEKEKLPYSKRSGLALPKSSVRRIMKLDDEIKSVNKEGIILAERAAVLFLEKFAQEAYSKAQTRGAKMIRYEDVADARVADPNLLFLEGVIPSVPGGT
mmetsp:Transcript_33040/g.43492  ORF Transcript_33040/g.43492 Transcript_33040/m.43492 type:complete len:128 (+) Transcript_33040:62-445(+)